MIFQLLRLLEETEADIRFRHGRALDPSRRQEASLAKLIAVLEERCDVQKFISPAYQHVDGTSFAAPIVSAVIAQMLEVNPELTPEQVKRGLTETARPLPNVPLVLQGAGVIQPGPAVQWAREAAQEATAGPG